MPLTRDAILAIVETYPREEIHVPEWGGSVWIRMMTASERDLWEMRRIASTNKDIRAGLLVSTLCDEHGALLFSEDDIEELGAKPISVIQRLFDAAIRINFIAPGDVEELKKNSQPTPS